MGESKKEMWVRSGRLLLPFPLAMPKRHIKIYLNKNELDKEKNARIGAHSL
jgi:hypothetical protein